MGQILVLIYLTGVLFDFPSTMACADEVIPEASVAAFLVGLFVSLLWPVTHTVAIIYELNRRRGSKRSSD